MTFTTAELCDKYSELEHFQIAEPIFKSFGAKLSFCGQITTLTVFEDNVLIRNVLEKKAINRVLVIDGGGSHRCALLGGNLANIASNNGWQGIIVYGCIRDSVEINQLPIGIRALHTHPLKSHKKGTGNFNDSVTFAGVHFRKDYYIYADADGIIVSKTILGDIQVTG